jgi:protein ImuB
MSSYSATMLWLGIHLPALALELFSRASASPGPLVITTGHGRRQAVLACNARAARRGIHAGMSVSAAQALAQPLQVQPRNAQAERQALERLAGWAGQFTSLVSAEPPQALLLEIGASRKLFGGLDRLVETIRQGVQALGYTAGFAVAPTPLGALWLARDGGERRVTALPELAGALGSLPLHRMDLTEAQRALLRGLGIGRLGECLRLPRDGLARRLGPEFVSALDRALGRLPDPRTAYIAPPAFHHYITLPAPADDVQGLVFALAPLLRELCGFLAARALGVKSLRLDLRHARVAATGLTLELVAPTREAPHLLGLLRERLERFRLPQPVEEIALVSETLCALASTSLDLFARARAGGEARAALVERLQARLGDQGVRSLEPVAEHRPECAWRYLTPGESRGDGVAGVRGRPLWLLAEPVVLELRDGRPCLDGLLTLEPDRERIESGWWDGRDVARDYYVACDGQGARLWIYRELTGARRWLLHGIFA